MLYAQIYLERLTDRQRLRMVTMVDVTEVRMDGEEVVLTLTDRMRGTVEEMRCDIVMLGTGFEPRMPALIRHVADQVGVDEITVSRAYRMITPDSVSAACYLQGTNEDTHGIADSLLSVLAIRAGEIVNDVLAHRSEPNILASVAASA
jgi:L-ornithine N5-oxygenase